jgi:uncharacterized membrane protein YdbT with pleckstrin-like domain
VVDVRRSGVRAPLAASIAVIAAILAAPVLVFVGAFSLRLVLGVETYRDSGAWVGVVVGALAAVVVLGVLFFRGLVAKGRGRR